MVLSMASMTPSGQRAVTMKPAGQFVDGHVVHAVDADLALAKDAAHDRVHFHDQGVTVIGIAGVEVRQGLGQVLGNVQEEVAALGDIQKLHPAADAEDRHPPLGDRAHQRAIEFLAASIQEADRGVEHETVVARIEIGAAAEHDPVQNIQHAAQVLFLP